MGPTNGYVDESKRKVVQYFVGGGNSVDENGGHGTHVAGTVLGEKSTDGVNAEDSDANGIAYQAKLAFCDIGSGGSGLNPSSDMKFLYSLEALHKLIFILQAGVQDLILAATLIIALGLMNIFI